MEIDKAKAAITSLCLFICSGFFSSFLIAAIYLVIGKLLEGHMNLLEALVSGGIYLPMLVFMALYSLDYTVRFAYSCKSSIVEYYVADESSKICMKHEESILIKLPS